MCNLLSIIDERLKEELTKLREKRVAFAAISFRIPTSNKSHEKIKNDEKSQLATEIEGIILRLVEKQKVNSY